MALHLFSVLCDWSFPKPPDLAAEVGKYLEAASAIRSLNLPLADHQQSATISNMSKVEFTVFKGSKNGDIVEAKGSRELDPFSAEIEVT